MDGLYLQCERSRRSWKDGHKVNVLCIIDQEYQRCTLAVDHCGTFKACGQL